MSDAGRIGKRTVWVDVAKFLAILAVMTDHTEGILYESSDVAYFSYYSVSLFIIVMGITTMWSYSRNSESLAKKVRNKCIGMIRPYVIATVIYCIFMYKSFDLEAVIYHLIRFNATGAFYYVLLYIQLVLISPVLFCIFEKTKGKKWGIAVEAASFVIVICISSWTTNHSNILGVYGGGGKLFGGTYLILLYLGMWVGKYYGKISVKTVPAGILAAIMLCCTIAWWRFIANDKCQIDLRFPFGEGFNPPGISLGLYAVLMALMLYFLETALLSHPDGIPMKIMEAFAFLGKHTLYIFLYHRFILDIVIPYISAVSGIVIWNVWIKRIIYFLFMTGGSMLLEYILTHVRKAVSLTSHPSSPLP